MATITLPLTDLVLDPAQPADLAALPAGSTETSASDSPELAAVGEALAHLRPAYDFLSAEAMVTLTRSPTGRVGGAGKQSIQARAKTAGAAWPTSRWVSWYAACRLRHQRSGALPRVAYRPEMLLDHKNRN